MTDDDTRAFWSGPVGEAWAALSAALNAHHAAVTEALVHRAAIRPGLRVLDVGTGDGALAARLSDAGARVTGIDLSAPLLAANRARAAKDVTLLEADAETHAFPRGSFDLIVSQFGVMFFDDSRTAFANLHRAAAPGGRLLFAAWAGAEHNPWFEGPTRIAAEMFGPGPSDPDEPGPMRFRDGGATAALVEAAGWRAAGVEVLDLHLTPPGDRAAVADFATRLGGASAALRRGGHGEADRLRLAERIRDWLAPYEAEGRVRVPGRINIVTART